MNTQRSTKRWAIGVAIAVLAVIAAAGIPAQKPSYEKICPITIEISPDSVLAKHCAAKVESDNALLAAFLIQLRQKIIIEKNPQPVTTFPAELTPDNFVGTYLRHPVLTTAEGTTLDNWDAIIHYLGAPEGIIVNSTYIDVQSVHVYLEYLPDSKGDVDFKAHVVTVLAYAPHDAPVTMSGTLCHSKLCVWEPCPPPI